MSAQPMPYASAMSRRQPSAGTVSSDAHAETASSPKPCHARGPKDRLRRDVETKGSDATAARTAISVMTNEASVRNARSRSAVHHDLAPDGARDPRLIHRRFGIARRPSPRRRTPMAAAFHRSE